MADYPEDTPAAFSERYVEGLRFIGIRGGSFVIGKDSGSEYPVPGMVNDFYILDREVTRKMYARFLDDEAEWRRSNLAGLLEKGLVTEEYLKDFDSPGPEDLPVRYVSYYAAEAFCRRLESALPSSLAGWSVRLPNEAEWEWVALADDPDGGTFQTSDRRGPAAASSVNSLDIYDLSGNLWEWCKNWYYPADYMVRENMNSAGSSSSGIDALATGAEKAVRGGSWANRRDDMNIRTRGSQPAAWCTPFTGFRPVIVRE
jgi:formylglycine-generating enzyme required for sulfatase activity